jgi:hypothetical protein
MLTFFPPLPLSQIKRRRTGVKTLWRKPAYYKCHIQISISISNLFLNGPKRNIYITTLVMKDEKLHKPYAGPLIRYVRN